MRRALAIALFLFAATAVAGAQTFPIGSVCSKSSSDLAFYQIAGDYYQCTYVDAVPVESNGRLYLDMAGPWALIEKACFWPREDWIRRYETAHDHRAPIPAPPECARGKRFAVAVNGSWVGMADKLGDPPVYPTPQPWIEPYPAEQGAFTPTPVPAITPGPGPAPSPTPDNCPGGQILPYAAGCYCSSTLAPIECPGTVRTPPPTPTETPTASPTEQPTPEPTPSPTPTAEPPPPTSTAIPVTPIPKTKGGGTPCSGVISIMLAAAATAGGLARFRGRK